MQIARRQFLLHLLLISSAMPLLSSCKREERGFRVAAPLAKMSDSVAYYDSVRPGPDAPGTPSTSQPVNIERLVYQPYAREYPNNAQALSDGQALYSAFNCVGCHAHGGGGIGPPLLDKKWFYGSESEQVYLSILQGRPNGMPSFRGRIPEFQIWELVAYVRSMSGQASTNAAAGREDHMNTTLPPNSVPTEKPEKVPEPTTGPTTSRGFKPVTPTTEKLGTDPAAASTTRPGKGQP